MCKQSQQSSTMEEIMGKQLTPTILEANIRKETNYGLVSIDNSGQDLNGAKEMSNGVIHWTNLLEIFIVATILVAIGIYLRGCYRRYQMNQERLEQEKVIKLVHRTMRASTTNLAMRTTNLCNIERGIISDSRSFQENTEIPVERKTGLYPRLETETQATVDRKNFQEPNGAGQNAKTREKVDASKMATLRWGGTETNV